MDSEAFYTVHNDLSCGPVEKLFQKKLFSDVRFPENKFAEDAFTMFRVILPTKQVAYSGIELYAYFQSSNSQTRSAWRPQKLDLLDAIQEIIDYSKEHNKLLVYHREIGELVKATYYNYVLAIEYSFLHEARFIKKRLKMTLVKYIKEYKITHKNAFIYATCWPRTIRIIYLFWIFVSKLRGALRGQKNKT